MDENFFDIIDTQEKAYWLGFNTADGSIKDTGRHYQISIMLKKEDENHLLKFLRDLDSNYKTRYIRNYVYIDICSKKMVKDLKKMGLYPNKVQTVEPCKKMPDHLERHYWRGLFDGDGWITKYRKPNGYVKWEIGLSGNKSMLEGFRKFISKQVQSNASVRKKKTCYVIQYGGKWIPRGVAKVLYENATIYLSRKKVLADQLISYKL